MWLIQLIFVPESMDSTNNLLYCWLVVATYFVSLYMISLSLISLAVERLIATVYAKTYEKMHSITIGVGLVLFQWFFAWGVILISVFTQRSNGVQQTTCRSQEGMSDHVLLISLYTVLLTSIIAVTTFIVLLYLNKRRYITTFLNRSMHTLSERYQLSENIKTTRFLYPVVTVNAICSLLGISLCIFMVVCSEETELGKIAVQVAGDIFSLLLAGYAAIFPWMSAFGHPELHRELKRTLRCCAKGSIEPGQPKNANGVALILNQNNERSAHFEALNNAWNT
uniref:G-protein coupled receptors family 1 profile domain-containing protein n=1 Tax=Plectus sambesii TaxID=2011161 RepID=A0A914X8W8_9BILA